MFQVGRKRLEFFVRILVLWAINATALLAMTRLLPGLHVAKWETTIAAAAVVGLLNAIIWPTIIALTNYSTSALVTEADIGLVSTARGSPLTGENAAARIAQLNIIDALFVCVAQRNYFRSEINLEKTMSSVDQKREK